ncbi:MAG TPA: hypothetical protein VIY86_11610 [Pirellulaceae bacterium]
MKAREFPSREATTAGSLGCKSQENKDAKESPVAKRRQDCNEGTRADSPAVASRLCLTLISHLGLTSQAVIYRGFATKTFHNPTKAIF